jgi:malonyl CoA-acyl carrier protein transacylase
VEKYRQPRAINTHTFDHNNIRGVFMKVFMFPGQGSQSKGMGGDLFDMFKELTEKADNILGYSIKKLCLNDPKRELNKTQFTQSALYVVNALSYYKKIEDTNKKPDFVAGHSLGELNALLAAECFDFETGLKIVKKRGELMSHAPKGGMAAILNASKEKIEIILQKNGLNKIDIANYNSPSQIVISGPIKEIAAAQEHFQGEMIYYPLNTSGAFHSRMMNPVKEKFEIYIKEFIFFPPKIPVISNVTARPYQAEEIVKNLSSQLAAGVKWSESIQYLLGLEKVENTMEFEEIGNGEVLTKIFQTIKSETVKSNRETIVSEESVAHLSLKEISTNLKDLDDSIKQKKHDNLSAINSVQNRVDAWNKAHPIGTKIKSTIKNYDLLETRTEAVVLFGHRAAVYIKDYNGYFDLDELEPVHS